MFHFSLNEGNKIIYKIYFKGKQKIFIKLKQRISSSFMYLKVFTLFSFFSHIV